MAVILSKKGTWTTRYCNATCHNAEGDKCQCICGGKLHGIGYQEAVYEVPTMTIEPGVRIEPHQMVLEGTND